MNPKTFVLIIAAMLVITSQRLPAPISEMPVSTATPKAKPKAPNAAETRQDLYVDSAHRFDGTWTAPSRRTETSENGGRSVTTTTATIVISGGRSAVFTMEITLALSAGTWRDLPSPLNVSPLSMKEIAHSVEFNVSGSSVRIRWSPPQLTDWSPESIPLDYREKFTKLAIKDPKRSANMSLYTLRGDELTLESGPAGKIIYKRMK